MKAFATPSPGLPYLLQSGAASIEQIRDRLRSNVEILRRVTPADETEQLVELTADEALLMAGNAERVALLLRKIAEGQI